MGELLIVADQATTFHDPCEGALDHPSALDDDKAFRASGPLDDFQGDVGLVLRPTDQTSGVAPVREHPLDEREGAARAFQHAAGAVAVLDVGGMDLDGEKAAVGVGQDVALASMDALAGIVTFESPF